MCAKELLMGVTAVAMSATIAFASKPSQRFLTCLAKGEFHNWHGMKVYEESHQVSIVGDSFIIDRDAKQVEGKFWPETVWVLMREGKPGYGWIFTGQAHLADGSDGLYTLSIMDSATDGAFLLVNLEMQNGVFGTCK